MRPTAMTEAEFAATIQAAAGIPAGAAKKIARAQYDPRVQRVFYTQTNAIAYNHKTGPVQIMTELGPATSLRHIPALGLEAPPRIGGNYLVIGAGQKVGRRVGKRRRRR